MDGRNVSAHVISGLNFPTPTLTWAIHSPQAISSEFLYAVPELCVDPQGLGWEMKGHSCPMSVESWPPPVLLPKAYWLILSRDVIHVHCLFSQMPIKISLSPLEVNLLPLWNPMSAGDSRSQKWHRICLRGPSPFPSPPAKCEAQEKEQFSASRL